MNTVGFDLYVRLLAESVDELRGKRTLPEQELIIDLPLGAHLPDDYIGDHDLKVRLYRRLANLADEDEVAAVEQEFKDRFGPPPPPVVDMFYLLRIKMLAKARFLRGIEAQGDLLIVRTSPFVVTDRLALYNAFNTQAVVRAGQIRIPLHRQNDRWKADLLKLLNTLRVLEPAAPSVATAQPGPVPEGEPEAATAAAGG
jgi:transcription-repair coupling factor (superfamily II helicase)